jgi:hypothetical protein
MSDAEQQKWFEWMMESREELPLKKSIRIDWLDREIQKMWALPSQVQDTKEYLTDTKTLPHFSVRQWIMYGNYPTWDKLQDKFVKVDNNWTIQYFTVNDFKNQKLFKKFDNSLSWGEERRNWLLSNKENESYKVDMNKYIQQKFGITESLLGGLWMSTSLTGNNWLDFTNVEWKKLATIVINFTNWEATTTLPQNWELSYTQTWTLEDIWWTLHNQLSLSSIYDNALNNWKNNETTDIVKQELTKSLTFLSDNTDSLITWDWTAIKEDSIHIGWIDFDKDWLWNLSISNFNLHDNWNLIVKPIDT